MYEAGTARERACMRSIKIDKLGSAVVNQLDDDDEDEYQDMDELVGNSVIEVVELEPMVDPATQNVFEWELF
jgi:hypothetical protein